MQGKRSLADYETSKMELGDELHLLQKTFSAALRSTQEQMMNFKIDSRARALEASIMQSFFAQYLKENFGRKAFYAKYKRLVLRTRGYLLLFKKLNAKGMPMNIKTGSVQSILNQSQILDLFASSDYNDEPILYFGYQKNRFGEYVNPQIVYIDEGKIVFSIGLNDMDFGLGLSVTGDAPIVVSPTIRDNNIKKAN